MRYNFGMDEQKTTETEKAAGSAVEKIAETLKINLSKERVPLPIKLIALLTLAGGLSIAAVYLYFERQFFEPSVFDYAIESLASFIKNWMIKT